MDAPKKDRKPVDAFTQEQARQFFDALADCPLSFRRMLLLLMTTGMRRGERIGLQRKDLDEQKQPIRIERNVIYTSKGGVQVSAPKTSTSVRSVPLMESVLETLQEYRKEIQDANPDTDLQDAFLFPNAESLFTARDPSSVTRRVKRPVP